MKKIFLPSDTTLSIITSQGIETIHPCRVDGYGDNRLIITTKNGAMYIVDNKETWVVNLLYDNLFTVNNRVKVVMDHDDINFLKEINSSIHKKDIRHNEIDLIVRMESASQMVSLDDTQAKNLYIILEKLDEKRDVDNYIIYGKGHVGGGPGPERELVIYVDIEERSYEYSYDLSTRELTKEEI